jgi:hypothetical protein
MGGMGGGHVLDDETTGGGPGPLVGGGSVGGGGALLGGDRNDDDAAERGGHTLPHGNIAASMLDAKARRGKVVQDINGPPTDADEPLQENLNARLVNAVSFFLDIYIFSVLKIMDTSSLRMRHLR